MFSLLTFLRFPFKITYSTFSLFIIRFLFLTLKIPVLCDNHDCFNAVAERLEIIFSQLQGHFVVASNNYIVTLYQAIAEVAGSYCGLSSGCQ